MASASRFIPLLVTFVLAWTSIFATYTLDGAGNRLAQTVDTVTTSFDLDLSVPNPTILADGTRTYLPGDPGAGYELAGTWSSALTDHLGTRLLTVSQTGTTGTPLQTGPYGLDRSGAVLATGIGYTGATRIDPCASRCRQSHGERWPLGATDDCR